MGSGVSSLTIKDAILNGEVEALTKNIRELMDDPEFLPNNDSIGFDPGWTLEDLPPITDEASFSLHWKLRNSRIVNHEDVVWLRPHQFGNGLLFSGQEPSPQHLNDNFSHYASNNMKAYSIANSLSTAAGSLHLRPDYIRRLFVFYNDIVGCVGVKLWNGKQLDLVVVDDKIPCWRAKKSSIPLENHFKPIFSSCSNGDAWLSILEKAVAKMYGSYENAYCIGGTRDVLRDICGEIVLEYDPGNILRNGWTKDLMEELTGKFKSGMAAGMISLPSVNIKHNYNSTSNISTHNNDNKCGSSNYSCNNDISSVNDPFADAHSLASPSSLSHTQPSSPNVTSNNRALTHIRSSGSSNSSGRKSHTSKSRTSKSKNNNNKTIHFDNDANKSNNNSNSKAADISIFDIDYSNSMSEIGYKDCIVLSLNLDDPRGVELLVDDSVVNALALSAAAAGRIAAAFAPTTGAKEGGKGGGKGGGSIRSGVVLEDDYGQGGTIVDGSSLASPSFAETIETFEYKDDPHPHSTSGSDGRGNNSILPYTNNNSNNYNNNSLVKDDDLAMAIADVSHFQNILIEDFDTDPLVVRKRRAFIPFHDMLHLSNAIKIGLLQTTPEKSHSVCISGQWSSLDNTAAGGKHLSSWRDNPIFRLKVSKRFGLTGLLRVSLSQADSRCLGLGHERRDMYEGVGITILADDARLTTVLADSGYKSQRDVVVELMLEPDMASLILIPSTFNFGLETSFLIYINYVVDTQFEPESNPMTLERINGWDKYPFFQQIYGSWHMALGNSYDEGRTGRGGEGRCEVDYDVDETAVGRISNVNPSAYMNPCWAMHIDVSEEDIENNVMIEMLYVLAHEQVVSIDEEDSGNVRVENRRTGLYTMTPYAYSQLLYNNGNFGLMDIDDGYLSKVAFADSPEIARVNNFRIRGDVSSDMKDYREVILMASTWEAGVACQFGIKLYCNRPFKLTKIDPRTFRQVDRLPIKSTVALKKRATKLAASDKSLRDLKASVVATSSTSLEDAQRLVLDFSCKLPPQMDKNLSFLSSQNQFGKSSRNELAQEVGATSYYSHQLIKTGTDFEPLTHFEKRKLEVRRRVRKYRASGFTHYKPENYYWDVEDENNVSMIKSRSNMPVSGTKTWDPIGSYKESVADKIREDTAKAFVHLETVVWKERYDPTPKVEEEYNPYLDIYGSDD